MKSSKNLSLWKINFEDDMYFIDVMISVFDDDEIFTV